MAVLATIGAIDTGSITLKRWGLLGPLICPGGAGDCDKVLNSAWGSLFGQPLSLFGFLAYAAVLVLAVLPLVRPGDSRDPLVQRSSWLLFFTSLGMAVFSLLLMGLMLFRIQAFCPFCVLSACLSLASACLSRASRSLRSDASFSSSSRSSRLRSDRDLSAASAFAAPNCLKPAASASAARCARSASNFLRFSSRSCCWRRTSSASWLEPT